MEAVTSTDATGKVTTYVRYVIKERCFFNNQLLNIGDNIELPKDMKVPEYFEKAK